MEGRTQETTKCKYLFPSAVLLVLLKGLDGATKKNSRTAGATVDHSILRGLDVIPDTMLD